MLKDEDGIAVFGPESTGLYGVYVFWPAEVNAAQTRFPKLGIAEIVRHRKEPLGWIPNTKDLNEGQLTRKKYNPRLFINISALDALIAALCELREKHQGASPPPEARPALAQAANAAEKKDFDENMRKVFGAGF